MFVLDNKTMCVGEVGLCKLDGEIYGGVCICG